MDIFISSLQLGFTDTVNPCSFANAVVFYGLLMFFNRSRKKILQTGWIFIFWSIVTTCFVVFGLYDRYLQLPVIRVFVPALYIGLGIAFIIQGALLFRSWIRFSQPGGRENEAVFFAFLPEDSVTAASKKQRLKDIASVLIVIFCAVQLTVLSSVWEKDYSVFLNFLMLFREKQKIMAVSSVAAYILTKNILLYFVLMIVYGFHGYKSWNFWVNKKISIFYLAQSAVCLAVGAGASFAFIANL